MTKQPPKPADIAAIPRGTFLDLARRIEAGDVTCRDEEAELSAPNVHAIVVALKAAAQ